jgi:hypothetical protein
MIRRSPLALLAAVLAFAAPGWAQPTEAPTEEAVPAYEIKVSLSREDPNVQAGKHEGTSTAEFFLFIDGGKTKGAEFGLSISGGAMDAYVIDTAKSWLPLPLENPYPGTIAQVRVGADCAESPCYLGRLLVKPDQAGEPVQIEIIPSLRAEQAVVLQCDLTTTQGFRAYPAALNAEAPRPRDVRGVAIDPEDAGTPAGAN